MMKCVHIRIVDLCPDDEKRINEVATLLMDAFREHSPDYCPDKASALEEIQELFEPGCISRVPVDEQGAVLGLIGGRPQEESTRLEVREHTPIPEAWLRPRGEGRYRHYCAHDLERLYREAGFGHVETIAYGQTYDLVNRAGLLEQLTPYQSQLAHTEAELAFILRLGSGPWLFAVADK